MTKRIVWLDSLKGLLMLIVVLTHSMQYVLEDASFDNHLYNLLISFMMPAFFAVSGYVNYRQKGGARLSVALRRFRQLVIPFLLWATIKIILDPPVTFNTFINVFLYPDGSFWFLWVLFIISVIFYFGDWMSECLKIKQELVIIFICVLLAAIMVICDVRIFGFQFISYYFLFFSIGYYINKYGKILSDRTTVIALCVFIWFILAWFWDMHRLPAFLSCIPLPQSLMQYLYRFVTAVVAVYFLFCLSPKILNQEKGLNTPLYNFGKISLGIYTTHLLLIPYIYKLLECFFNNNVVLIILTFSFAVALSWAIVYMLNKWSITSKLLLGKI